MAESEHRLINRTRVGVNVILVPTYSGLLRGFFGLTITVSLCPPSLFPKRHPVVHGPVLLDLLTLRLKDGNSSLLFPRSFIFSTVNYASLMHFLAPLHLIRFGLAILSANITNFVTVVQLLQSVPFFGYFLEEILANSSLPIG